LEVLSSFFGQHFAFTDHTYDFNGLGPRSYPSFAAAGIECGKSRFYGGIHYDVSVETSRPYVVVIGDDVAKLQLMLFSFDICFLSSNISPHIQYCLHELLMHLISSKNSTQLHISCVS
jgi:hypothetical protein